MFNRLKISYYFFKEGVKYQNIHWTKERAEQDANNCK